MTIEELLPKPDLNQARRLLCVQPHPDDMDISAGGTLARLADNGTAISYLTVTDDTAGFMDSALQDSQRREKQRQAEQMAAGKILGINDYYWLNAPDAGDWSLHAVRNRIIEHIRRLRPDFIMTVDPWLPYEAHQDHVKCGLATSEALLLFNFPFIKTPADEDFEPYEITGAAFSFTAKPNTIIDVSQQRERKFRAIAAHRSQFTDEMLAGLKLYDQLRSQKLAARHDFEFGEGFKVLNPTYMLHAFPEAVDY